MRLAIVSICKDEAKTIQELVKRVPKKITNIKNKIEFKIMNRFSQNSFFKMSTNNNSVYKNFAPTCLTNFSKYCRLLTIRAKGYFDHFHFPQTFRTNPFAFRPTTKTELGEEKIENKVFGKSVYFPEHV